QQGERREVAHGPAGERGTKTARDSARVSPAMLPRRRQVGSGQADGSGAGHRQSSCPRVIRGANSDLTVRIVFGFFPVGSQTTRCDSVSVVSFGSFMLSVFTASGTPGWTCFQE